MLKVLGAIDVLTAIFLFIFLKFGTFEWILVAFLILLILKSLITLKDLFSILDLFSSLIIILAIFSITSPLTWIVLIWLLVKGLWSLASSV